MNVELGEHVDIERSQRRVATRDLYASGPECGGDALGADACLAGYGRDGCTRPVKRYKVIGAFRRDPCAAPLSWASLVSLVCHGQTIFRAGMLAMPLGRPESCQRPRIMERAFSGGFRSASQVADVESRQHEPGSPPSATGRSRAVAQRSPSLTRLSVTGWPNRRTTPELGRSPPCPRAGVGGTPSWSMRRTFCDTGRCASAGRVTPTLYGFRRPARRSSGPSAVALATERGSANVGPLVRGLVRRG